MGDLDHVIKALERKKNPPKDVSGEILEEVRMVGTAIEMQQYLRKLASITLGLESRIDKMEAAINGKVEGIPVPPALDGLHKELNTLRSELGEALPLLAKEIKVAQEAYKRVEFPAPQEIPQVDLSPIHNDMDSFYQALAQMTVPQAVVREVVEQQPKRAFTFDVKRNNQGFIKSVDVKER